MGLRVELEVFIRRHNYDKTQKRRRVSPRLGVEARGPHHGWRPCSPGSSVVAERKDEKELEQM